MMKWKLGLERGSIRGLGLRVQGLRLRVYEVNSMGPMQILLLWSYGDQGLKMCSNLTLLSYSHALLTSPT